MVNERVTSFPLIPKVLSVELFDAIPTLLSVGTVRSVVTVPVPLVTFVPAIPAPLLKATLKLTGPSASLELAS